MIRKALVLLVAMAALAAPAPLAEAAPKAPPVTTVQAIPDSVGPPRVYHPWTTRAKADLKLALKIRAKAQHGRTLDYRKARRVTHNKRVLADYMRGLTRAGGKVTHKPKSAMSPSMPLLSGSCDGATDAAFRPYGFRIRLNSCKTNELIAVSAGAAAIAAFISAIHGDTDPARIVGAVTEFVFTWGAIELGACNRNSTGTRIFYVLLANFVYCRSQ